MEYKYWLPDEFGKKTEQFTDCNAVVIIGPETKNQFSTYATEIIRLMKYLDRNDIGEDTKQQKDVIVAIYNKLQKKRKHIDTTDLMAQINGILGDYILIET